jgi:hypothetical protein
MLNKWVKILALAAVMVVILACGSTGAVAPTADLQATMSAGIALTKAAQQAVPAQPQQPAQPQVDVQATVDAQVQQTVAAQGAATAAAAALAQPAPTEDQSQPQPEQPPASVADSSQTGEAAMAQFVQELVDSNRLSIGEGTYIKLEDFSNSVYKNQAHEWWKAGQQASDFVLRANVKWRGDAKASASGCGFLYSGLALDDYHITVLSTEGIVHTYRSRGGNVIEMKGGKYSKNVGISAGEAQIVLVVDDKKMTFYVNGEQVVQFKDPYINTGNLGYAINSFSSNGMNCQFTNVELWKIY